MVCGYVGILILVCFSFMSCCITLVDSIDGSGNLEPIGKNTTFFTHVPFRFANSQDEGGNIISHYAMWRTNPRKFYGLRAEISLWGSPNQTYSQESGASIQMYCQDGGHYNFVEVGFHVSPSLYHNRDVRFFTYWSKDSKSAGCYNLQCKGFVPASGAALVPGQAVAPPSSYGEYYRYVRLSLNQDPNSGDWVVYRNHGLENPSFLGHFPVELCPGTPRIQALAGFVNYYNTTKGPLMGSGHFPDGKNDDKKVGCFKHVKTYDSDGYTTDPFTTMIPLVDKPNCYTETDLLPDPDKGYSFYYGGPSGCIG
ncbi:hypothetical protein ACQ4PT_047691 [Festuca glaucescens]